MRRFFFKKLLIVLCILLVGCTGLSVPSEESDLTQAEIGQLQQNRWLFQLQDLEIPQAVKHEFPIIVMGPELGGINDKKFSKQEVTSMKEQGTLPVAYLSIGEASFYDSYWQDEWGSFVNDEVQVTDEAPDWLGKIPNKSWPEGVKVRYWEEEWWDIIEAQLDRIMESGYEGVYLDIVDAFQYWGAENTYGTDKEERLETDPRNEEEAAVRMIEFLRKLSNYTKESNSDFKIIPQNGESIIKYDQNQDYLQSIDGIGVEDLWFNEEEPGTFTENRLAYLKRFSDHNKIVLSVDYVDNGEGYYGDNKERIESYVKSCLSNNFYCYPALSDRELDTTHVIEEIQKK